jgi:glycosyltransferase involved in cell wall biosynthesis
MRIGMLLDNDFRSDPRVLNEAKALFKGGHEVHIICFSFGDLALEQNLDGIFIHRYPLKRIVKDVLFIMMNFVPIYTILWYYIGSKAVRKYKIQVIHAHDLYMSEAANMIKNKFNIPLTLDLHENFPSAIKSYKWIKKFPHRLFVKVEQWEKNENNLLSNADSIVVLSKQYANYLKKKHPNLAQKNFIVYPNVPDISFLTSFDATKKIEDLTDGFWLFYFGGISERRGVFIILDAIINELSAFQVIKLLLVGPVDKAESKRFNQVMKDPLLKNRVIYFPWRDISELPALINASSVCLSPIEKNPQHDSGIANKVFQYMLFGKPLLVSNSTPQAELVNETGCGLVFESGNRKDFSLKVLELFRCPILDKIGQNGRRSVLQTYNLDNFGKELNKIYSDSIPSSTLFSENFNQN